MNTRISSLPLKQNTSATSKQVSILRSGAKLMDTVLSMVLALFAAVFFMWINGRQHEFDQLQDKPN
jgi:hypothetical protein